VREARKSKTIGIVKMDDQETITVITGDCEYQIKANNWTVSEGDAK
jgi:hypothetical protein